MDPTPIVSIIIPTSGRREDLLTRAVRSCLAGFAAGEVEIIVVPNGPNNFWQPSLAAFEDNPMVASFPIKQADANTARNHGLARATGRYVRFLDDDDELLPTGTKEQYDLMDKTRADIATGAVSLVNNEGREMEILRPSTKCDFVASLLDRDGVTIPVAHVFRREFIRGLAWLPGQPFLQDQLWMHIVARHAEPEWIKTEQIVGVWHHHDGHRISIHAIRSVHTALMTTSRIIMESVEQLQKKNRMSATRNKIAAQTLWNISDECFYLSPWHWHKVAKFAMTLNPDARPETGAFGQTSLPPLFLEWLMVPWRWAKAFVQWLMRRISR